MKILKLTTENIKKISVVEISPQGNVVQITGRNGQGKSSVLDSIWYALGGTDDNPQQPIRTGAESASITIDLGEYVVTRKFTEKGTTLTVKSKDGAHFPSPQTMLNKMLGDMTFDPLEFAHIKPRDQFDRLRHVAKIGDELEAIEQKEKAYFDNRTDANREVKRLEAQVAGITVAEGTPEEPIDVSAVVAEGERLRDENTAIAQAVETMRILFADITKQKQAIEDAKTQIISLENNITESLRIIQGLDEKANTAPHDLQPLRDKVASANTVNAAVAQRQLKDKLKKDLAEAEVIAKSFDTNLEASRKAKAELFEKAAMPVEGLTLVDGQVFYRGIPFSQASTAEQLRVSVAIAMAANPTIRVIRIKDASLLDDENMASIAAMANEKDYQVWLERVDGSGEVGVVIEDGRVKNINE